MGQEIQVVHIRHPLLESLQEFNAEAARRFPADFDQGLGQLGLLLQSKLANGGYWCTPINSVSFGDTGGDGVHFSFVVENDTILESSPVIVTVPANSGEPADANLVVGENLRDFLRFGLHRGYFALEQLAYCRDLTLHVYSTPEWQPTEDWHYSVGYQLYNNAERMRDFLVETFDLTPLAYSVAEFEDLQNRYQSLLEFPPDDE